MTTTYRGQADVARWCGGVTAAAISNWMRRHPDTVPVPDAVIVNEGGAQPVRGWLPERRLEWEAFNAVRSAGSAAGSASTAARRNRKAAEKIYQDARAGLIDPATAIELLHELI